MVTKHKFILRSYRNGGGSDEEDDVPRHFIVEITQAQAAYYMKRMALVSEVEKVDPAIKYMSYSETPGKWWYRLNEDEDGPAEDDQPAGTEANQVHVHEDRVYWNCYHDSSGYDMITEDLGIGQLKKLAMGQDPNKHQEEEVPPMPSSFSPMQTLINMQTQVPEQMEVTFDTIQGGNEGEGEEGEPEQP